MSSLVYHYASLTALAWSLTGTSTLFVALRIFVRFRLRALGAEDLLMFLAWSCTLIVASIFQYTLVRTFYAAGDVRTPVDQDPADLLKFHTVDTCLLYLCGLFAKASVALLLLRLVGPTSRKTRILILSALALYSMATLLAVVCALIPPCDLTLLTTQPYSDVYCMRDGTAWVAIIQTWNFCSAGMDALYSIVATLIICKVQVNARKKIGLSVVLSLGWITAVLATWRAVGAWVYTTEQKQVLSAVAISLEANLVIICGCLPTLWPLWELVRNGKPLKPRGSIKARVLDAESGLDAKPVHGDAQGRGRPKLAKIGGWLNGGRKRSAEDGEDLLTPVEREAMNKTPFSASVTELRSKASVKELQNQTLRQAASIQYM